MSNNRINIKNKKAYFNYELIEKYEAGIELLGTEIKSIRAGKVSLTDAYCKFIGDELWILMRIAEYEYGNINNHDPNRRRKLLLSRRELNKLERKIKQSSLTIIPLRLYLNNKSFAKVQIALAKGRKKYDHRQAIKEKDAKRDLAVIRKQKNY